MSWNDNNNKMISLSNFIYFVCPRVYWDYYQDITKFSSQYMSSSKVKHLLLSLSCCLNICMALAFSTLGKIFSKRHIKVFFFLFFQKTGFDSSFKLSPLETIWMKCQILFSGKKKENIINLSSAELAKRELKVKKCFGTKGTTNLICCLLIACYRWVSTETGLELN